MTRMRLSFITRAMLLAPFVSLVACKQLLDVAVPNRVLEGAIADPAQAPLLVNSAVGAFECAFGATTVATGLITDELIDAQSAQAVIPYDKRDVHPEEGLFSVYASSDCSGTGPNGLGVYTPLSSARWFADDLAKKLEAWSDAEVPNRQSLLSTARAYAGYSLVLLGEVMCTAAIDGGPELTRTQLLTLAEDRFTKAIAAAQASGNTDILNLAYVGRARARIDQGKTAEALADASLVPTNYLKNVTAAAGATIRENRLYAWNNRQRLVSVDVPFRNLTFAGVADPRVPVVDANVRGADAVTPIWTQGKYVNEASPTPLATWEEAQLIIAEVSLGQTAVQAINRLHAKVGLPSFSSNDDAAIRAQVIEERRRQLFLDSHRLGDMIRFQQPFLPAAGTPYPKTGLYGTTTCLPLPDRERDNNPNIGRP
jgi:hypothetical protein